MRTVRWNGDPLHEATSAIVKESINGDFILTVKYPISDTGIYKRIKEDMLIKCPTPVLGPQLFRIKKPVEDNDQLEITAYHITDDIMQRSVKPVKVANQTCSIALSQMVQNAKTDLGDFSFTSDIQEHRTFNMTETENIYSVLLDGKHSIVGTWEGELVRDNFSLTVKKNRGENRGVVITTHKNLKSYQRSKNSQNVITRIHARSTFKPEGSEHETTIKVTVDSPLINSYPYINEKEYENNNAKTVEELKKWAQAKFTNEGIDKVSDSIKLEAYELDGQIVHLGDTVNLKSLKHNVDIFKKAVAYEYDGLKEEYISLEFDDKAGFGGSGVSNGLSDVTNAILEVTYSVQEIAIERAARNANLAFEHQSNQLKKEVEDGIELIKAKAEENKHSLSEEINRRFHDFSPEGFDEAKRKAEEALKKAGASAELADEAKHLASETQVAFGSITNRVNKQDDKLDSAIKDNALKFAEYKQAVSERIANLSSQMTGKANQVEFQRVKETAQLYERILGSSESDISRNASRLVMSDQVFQTEVGKYVTDDNNLIVNSMTMDKHTLINANKNGVNVSLSDSIFTIKAQGLTYKNWTGFTLPIYVKKVYRGETYTLGFKYRFREYPDDSFSFVIKNHRLNKNLTWVKVGDNRPPLNEWQDAQKTFTLSEDFVFGEEASYPFYVFLPKNGWVEFKEPILVRGSNTGPYKPSQFDDAYKMTEATRTQVTQLAGSYAIQNLNSAGDLINGINIGANGHNRFVGKLTHITGDTLIDNAVIKSAMIDKLKTANFEAGSVTTNILGAEAVTAEKVKFDTAFIQKLVSQQAFIDELFAKQATITQIQSIDITADHVKGGKLTSLNGVTDFDLQTGWIDMNGFGVGLKNKFPDRPLQYLVFGAGNINGVDASYTALLSNRNGRQAMDSTSAGVQIWNGRTGSRVQSAINMYGQRITFNQSAQGGLREVAIDTDAHSITGLDEIYIKNVRLSYILNDIYDNFRNLGAVPGNYSRGYHSQWR